MWTAAGACSRAIWASWAPMACSSQAPSLALPSSSPARASSRLLASDGGAGQPGGFCDPKHHVIEGIEIAEDGECRGKCGRTTGGGSGVCLCHEPGSVVLRSRCMELISCWVVARISLGAFQWATLRLVIAVWTLARAGRKLVMAKPVGAGAAAAWAAAGVGLLAHGRLRSRRETTGSKALLSRVMGIGTFFLPKKNGEGAMVTCGAFDGLGMLQQNKGCSSLCGPVAQLGARFHGMEEVIGSIPIRSTK